MSLNRPEESGEQSSTDAMESTPTASRPEPATSGFQKAETDVGSVFVSNYPPFSFWTPEGVETALEALEQAPVPETPLGLYLHIPFCRKRCKFCYFRVYTDKDSGQIGRYVEALAREVEAYSTRPAIAGRPLRFVYFGGGTPSYISVRHLEELVRQVRSAMPWDEVEEVAFECEPGTLTRSKLEAIRGIGVTRLSLGIENFDDEILRENGRAHVSKEIYRVWPWIEELGFDQVNVDLIAGMLGETWETWRETVRRTIELDADSVTVYQLELPFNTRFSSLMLKGELDRPVADWTLKRRWHDYAFAELEAVGYELSSAYTMVRKGPSRPFVYRDSVWRGCDMVGAGVSSFSHVSGVHFQNSANWGEYLTTVEEGRLPLIRGFATTADERLTREVILQLKHGRLDGAYFNHKFGPGCLERFTAAFDRLREREMLEGTDAGVRLTRQGLLQADSLLPEFYAERYRHGRYT